MKAKQIFYNKVSFLAKAAFLTLVIIGCSKDDTDNKITANINEYLTGLPKWESFSPPKLDTTLKQAPTLDFSCEDHIVSSTTECSITRTPEEIITHDPNSEILYLGSLIQGDGYLKGLGSMKPLIINERSPITVSISLQMPDNFRVVENPKLNNVKEAIGDLVQSAEDAGHVPPSSIMFIQRSCYSVEQAALSLGLSAKFMSASARLKLSYETTSTSHTVSAHFVQKMFTTSMNLPTRPGDLFSADFTQELLDEQINQGNIGPNNLPVYVSNIVWGRIMTLTMTSEYSEQEMSAALDASYKCVSGNLDAYYAQILQESTIELVTLGGPEEAALALLRSGNLRDFFSVSTPLSTAVPISYTLRNVADNNIAKISETASYQMVQNDIANWTYYNEDQAFANYAIENNWLTFKKFETTEPNIYLANEVSYFWSGGTPGGQTALTSCITFSPISNTGLPFDFYLKNKAYEGNLWGLVINENEGSFPVNTISIGDIGDLEDDDFEIGVTGDKVYGIGCRIIQNDADNGEYMAITAAAGCPLGQQASLPSMENGFVGFISPVPLQRINFNEAAGGDDMGVMHFYFLYKNE